MRSLRSSWATGIGVWVSGWMPAPLAFTWAQAVMFFELLAGPLLFVPGVRGRTIALAVMFHLATVVGGSSDATA